MLREINRILTGKEKKQAAVIAGFDLLMALLDIGFVAVLMLLVSRYTQPVRPEKLSSVAFWFYRMPPLLFLALFLIKNAAAWGCGANAHRFFAAVSTRLSAEQLQRYFSGSPDNFNKTDASVFVRRISQQPIEFSTYILANLQAIVSQGLLAGCAIAAILCYHPTLFIILFVLLLPPLIWIGWLLRSRLKTVRQHTKRIAEKAIQFLQESLGGYVEANIYGRTGFFVGRFISQQKALNENIARQQTLQTLPSRLLEAVVVAGFFLLAGIRTRVAGEAETDWITLGVFLGAAWKIIPALVRMLNSSGQMKTYSFILRDLVPAAAAACSGYRETSLPGDAMAAGIGYLSVQHLQFCHGPGKPELKTSFQLAKGNLVALTGRSGSGKTTLLQLVAGILKPGKGTIRIGNEAGGSAMPPSGLPGIVYVKQQPFLLNDSLWKNISLSDTEADLEKITRIAHCCGLGPLIAAHARGLELPVSENGRNLSGGQRQRIMMARALYHNPQLLLLDEPFSELDEPAEMEMMQFLSTLAGSGMTVMIATHSAAAAACCDFVISLDKPVYA